MSKAYNGPWILRTVLFTAGHNQRYINKAFTSKADCIVLDLEDAVPNGLKDEARKRVQQVLSGDPPCRQPVMVRINPFGTGLSLADLDGVACKNLSGFVYPKAQCGDDIKAFDAMLSLKEESLGLPEGHFDLIPLIETPRAVLNAYDIAVASSRVVGLLFGCEDFLADMESSYGPDQRSLLIPRHMIVMAARAAGVVPIDTPYIQVHDDDGLREHIRRARELGFEGMLVMTMRQIDIARELYSPTASELAEASQMAQYASDAVKNSRGIAVYGDTFVSPPTLKGALKTINRHEAVRSFERYLAGQ